MSTRLVIDASGAGRAAVGRAPTCAHCGQPAPPALEVAGEPWFCCPACETVHELLASAGLGEYYAFRERLGARGVPVRELDPGAFSELDAPAFQRLYCSRVSDAVDRVELELGGLHCAACVWLVERLPRVEQAVERACVDLGRGRVTLDFRARGAGSVRLSRVAAALSRLGYAPRPARGLLADRERQRELRQLLLRIGVAGASAGNVMLLAFALYGGADEIGGLPEAGTWARRTLLLFHGATWLVSLPALWAAGSFFRGAVSSLRNRTPHMDLPIALGISTAFVWGTVSIVVGQGELYFDTITTLIFLLLIGRYLDVRHRQRASQAAELLTAVLPGHARRLLAEPPDAPGDASRGQAALSARVESVPLESLEPGDVVLVQSGQTVPVDGVVRSGSSTLDLSLMSGESRPSPVGVGAEVLAGALNLGGQLEIEVEKAGAETRVGALLRAVERAGRERPRVLGWANRLAGRFTWLVMGSALLVFSLWASRSTSAALSHALAVLIVACPCALGMATPLALTAAVTQAARRGILVFGAASLERLAVPALIVLDKTGTLTTGQLEVVRRVGGEDLDPFVLAIEEDAHHPAGRALCRYLVQRGVRPSADVRSTTELLGAGLRAEISGGELLVGSAAFVLARAEPTREVETALATLSGAESAVLVALGGRAVGAFFLEDQIRSDAAASLRELSALGHDLAIVSGDADGTVRHVAAELVGSSGVRFETVLSGVSPEQKLRLVEEWAAARPVVMVGDGVNDAGALAAAQVGVAVGGAAEAARLAADVYLSRVGVHELAQLMSGARRTLCTIQRGVGFSLGYNLVGIALAAAGLLSPLVAAVLMPLSSLTVVTHAFRSRSFSAERGAS